MNEKPLESVRDLIANLVGFLPTLLAGVIVLLLGLAVAWIGAKIVVRRSKAGEKLLALDHRVYDLPVGLLVIADGEKPVALAGVMGGEDSAVTTATKRIILEGAFFNPVEARKSSQKTRLRSDSSYRFERGTDPEAPRAAADRAAALILQIAGGSAAKPFEVAARIPARTPIRASVAKINGVLGSDFTDLAVMQALGAIGLINGNGVEDSRGSNRRHAKKKRPAVTAWNAILVRRNDSGSRPHSLKSTAQLNHDNGCHGP